MTKHPLTIQTKRLPYESRSLADKVSDGVNQILMVEVTINDTTIDLGLLRGEDRRELAAHLRDVADELDPQEDNPLDSDYSTEAARDKDYLLLIKRLEWPA